MSTISLAKIKAYKGGKAPPPAPLVEPGPMAVNPVCNQLQKGLDAETKAPSGWLNSAAAKAKIKNELAKASGPIKSKHVKVIEETAEELAGLPVWQRTGSAKSAHTILSNGAGILPKSRIADGELPRVKGYEKVFTHLAGHHGKRSAAWTEGFLRDVDFWHHHSTDGRKNPETGRWDRWWVQPLEAFLTEGPHVVSESTFHRVRKALAEDGVIEVEVHSKLVEGEPVNCLWIKPTETFERCLFTEDAFDQLLTDPTKKASHKKSTKKKPRGLSAWIAERDADLKSELANYEDTLSSTASLMALYDRCAEETVMDGDGKRPYRIRPYFSKRGARVRMNLFHEIVQRLVYDETVLEHLDWLTSRKPPKYVGVLTGPNHQTVNF